jgi:hypothetical protein
MVAPISTPFMHKKVIQAKKGFGQFYDHTPYQELPLFSVCYFHHEKDSDASRSKSQAHTMDGIVLG